MLNSSPSESDLFNNLFYNIILLEWLSSCHLRFILLIFINIPGNLNHKNMTNYLTNEVKISIFTIFNNIFVIYISQEN